MKQRIYCNTVDCRRYANLDDNRFCPSCVSLNAVESLNNDVTCKICSDKILESDLSTIGCDSCSCWFHSSCAGPPAELVKLLESMNKSTSSGTVTLKGMLLWLCPDCLKTPQRLSIECTDSSCKVVDTSQSIGNNTENEPEKTMQEKSYGSICDQYMKSSCPFGISG